MDTIFMNSENSKKSDPQRPLFNLLDNLNIYYIWKSIKSHLKTTNFKILAPTWNEEFEITLWIIFCIRYSRAF